MNLEYDYSAVWANEVTVRVPVEFQLMRSAVLWGASLLEAFSPRSWLGQAGPAFTCPS